MERFDLEEMSDISNQLFDSMFRGEVEDEATCSPRKSELSSQVSIHQENSRIIAEQADRSTGSVLDLSKLSNVSN